MAATSLFRSLFLSHLSKPVSDRLLFRSVSKIKPQRIVEVGLDNGDRGIELVELAQRQRPTVEIRYTGIDMFEARPESGNSSPLKLKDAHQQLKATDAKIKLVPGEPMKSLIRVSNELASTDMLVISFDESCFEPNWFYVPRMLHDHSVVFWQTERDGAFQPLTYKDVQRLVAQTSTERRAAA